MKTCVCVPCEFPGDLVQESTVVEVISQSDVQSDAVGKCLHSFSRELYTCYIIYI